MREETILSLKWESFPSQLALSLDTCYEKQQFVDVSLVCKDGTIVKCHKMILANSSPFFRRLLVANEHPHPMIILHDIEADDLKTIVNFMYSGEIQVVQSEVKRLLEIASILEVNGLQNVRCPTPLNEPTSFSGEFSRVSDCEMERNIKIVGTTSVPWKKSSSDSEAGSNCSDRGSLRPGESFVNSSARISEAINKLESSNRAIHEFAKRIEESFKIISPSSQRPINCRSSAAGPSNDVDAPSTSCKRSFAPTKSFKRKSSVDPAISWSRIISAISKDKRPPAKLMCIMDEVEITASDPVSCVPSEIHEACGQRRRLSSSRHDPHMNCAVIIKDELDLGFDSEEENARTARLEHRDERPRERRPVSGLSGNEFLRAAPNRTAATSFVSKSKPCSECPHRKGFNG
ncbi:protein abrupt [Cephus cinctus]|uniref:Protein abrupt n=1 Tax=Cephus cinctus TaxID=211228 RepID=A0AAJ7CF43_CEPCN|nr:protein abrupt [Cephus cinctus]